jgi:ribosome maturation factor RimP
MFARMEVGRPTFFVAYWSLIFADAMTHPLAPQIWQIAEAIAPELGLEVIDVVVFTHKSPPIVRIDVRNLTAHTGLDDCERMTNALGSSLDEVVPFAYVLEVSSPGTARQLQHDREFRAFKGFKVTVSCNGKFQDRQQWLGQLVERTEGEVVISQKGKLVAIPRHQVSKVELTD